MHPSHDFSIGFEIVATVAALVTGCAPSHTEQATSQVPVASVPSAPTPTPTDSTRPTPNPRSVFRIMLAADGSTLLDGEAIGSDDALLALAVAAEQKNTEFRAVITAEPSVTHARVIQLLDVLKRAGVAKIALAVTPASTPGQ